MEVISFSILQTTYLLYFVDVSAVENKINNTEESERNENDVSSFWNQIYVFRSTNDNQGPPKPAERKNISRDRFLQTLIRLQNLGKKINDAVEAYKMCYRKYGYDLDESMYYVDRFNEHLNDTCDTFRSLLFSEPDKITQSDLNVAISGLDSDLRRQAFDGLSQNYLLSEPSLYCGIELDLLSTELQGTFEYASAECNSDAGKKVRREMLLRAKKFRKEENIRTMNETMEEKAINLGAAKTCPRVSQISSRLKLYLPFEVILLVFRFVMKVYQQICLVIVFVSGIFPSHLTIKNQQQLPSDFSTEDRTRLEHLKLSDITRKGLRLVVLVNKTKGDEVEPRVYDVLNNFTLKIKRLKDDIILLRKEILSCGNASNITLGNSWKEVFHSCIANTNAELYAVASLTNIISNRAKMIKDFRYELRLKPIDKALLVKAIEELNSTKHQLANSSSSRDLQTSLEYHSTTEKIQNALVKFEKTLVFACHYLQMQLDRLENPKEIVVERLLYK